MVGQNLFTPLQNQSLRNLISGVVDIAFELGGMWLEM
jgi:hypothetical protein